MSPQHPRRLAFQSRLFTASEAICAREEQVLVDEAHAATWHDHSILELSTYVRQQGKWCHIILRFIQRYLTLR